METNICNRARVWSVLALSCSIIACGSEAPGGTIPTAAPGSNAGAPAPAAQTNLPTTASRGMATAPSPTAAAAGAASLAIPPPPKAPTTTPTQTAPVSGATLPCGVSKVLAAKCQNCHASLPIGGAPMALMTHADFHAAAKTQPSKKVYELAQLRIHDTMRPMPPTSTLAAAEMSALDPWLRSGAPAGSAEEAKCQTETTNPSVTNVDGSRGRLTAGPNEKCYEFKVHGSTTKVDETKFNIPPGEQYEQFYYSIPWPDGVVGTSYATITDNAQVLHHWLLFSTNELQTDGAHFTAPLPTLIGTDPILMAGWAVGGPNLVAPEDVGFELPKPGNRVLNVQWHFYNSTSSLQADASSVQICTIPSAMRKNVATVTWTGTEDLNGNVWFGGAGMPPHKETTFTSTCVPGRRGMNATDSIHILGFEPHMHRIGKRMTTAVVHTDGKMEMLFDKPFSFGNETHYYQYYELKAGEKLVTSCTFNNTNDFGVPFGESSDSEMCYQFVFSYPAHALSNRAPSILGVTDTCW